MKKILLACIGLLLAATSCNGKNKAQNSENQAESDGAVMVAYFSATGTTKKAAERIAGLIGDGATLYEIKPAVAYTEADLDWRDSTSRSSVEMHNRTIRPALADSVTDLSKYDVIFIGYPNWWNTAPTIINTFIENNDLKGKTVVPFMTSGGSDIINSEKELGEAYPTLLWKEGLLMNDVTDDQIKDWINASLKK